MSTEKLEEPERISRLFSDIENRFKAHPPFGNQPERYAKIRAAAKEFADIVADCAFESRELALSLTKIQEASMWAITAIACNEKETP